MGQPKFARKKFETPNHPWQGDRIKEEHEIRRKFGLKNKSEIWKAQSRLRSIRGQARELISRTRNPDDLQAKNEAERLVKRLHREGYVGEGAGLNEVLGLDIERILNRRLQSQVYLKGMARTPKQARQFVAHGLVRVGDRRVNVPSYVVRRHEEELIVFEPTAAVADENHPVRPRAPGVEAREALDEPEAAPEGEAKKAPEGKAEAPAGKAAEKTEEAAAEKVEAKPDEKPTEAQKADDKPGTEKADEKPEDKPTEAQKADDKPEAEKADEKPEDKPTEAQKADDKPEAEKAEEQPQAEPENVEPKAEGKAAPDDAAEAKPAEAKEAPADKPEEPKETPADKPADKPEEPKETPADKPADETEEPKEAPPAKDEAAKGGEEE